MTVINHHRSRRHNRRRRRSHRHNRRHRFQSNLHRNLYICLMDHLFHFGVIVINFHPDDFINMPAHTIY